MDCLGIAIGFNFTTVVRQRIEAFLAGKPVDKVYDSNDYSRVRITIPEIKLNMYKRDLTHTVFYEIIGIAH